MVVLLLACELAQPRKLPVQQARTRSIELWGPGMLAALILCCPSSSIQDVVDFLPFDNFCLGPLAVGRFLGESGDPFFLNTVYLKGGRLVHFWTRNNRIFGTGTTTPIRLFSTQGKSETSGQVDGSDASISVFTIVITTATTGSQPRIDGQDVGTNARISKL